MFDTYVDEGISGSKDREIRKEFDRLNKDMIRRKFTKIMVWDISRLGRSLQHLVEFLNDVISINCNLYIHQSGLDTSTPSGKIQLFFKTFVLTLVSKNHYILLKLVRSAQRKI